MRVIAGSTLLVLALAGGGCGDDDDSSPDGALADGGAGDAGPDGGTCRADGSVGILPAVESPSCAPLVTDYTPRIAMSSLDAWPECISDDGIYHPLDPSISTVARVAAFERIAALLWQRSGEPTAEDFLAARLLYTEANGLESRLSRREDEHYPAAPMLCANLSAADLARNADRCAGPAQIQPLLNAAFLGGARGESPRLNAARIEAGLLWFLFISPYKEARTCATAPQDCDSSFAYYTGGEQRSGGLGLSRLARATGPAGESAHDRAFDAVLAVRCWRDLDNPTGLAMDLSLRDRAVLQLDRALHRVVALIVRARAVKLAGACGDGREPDLVFIQILGRTLLREAALRDPTAHMLLANELTRASADDFNPAALVLALDRAFPCP